MKNMYIIDINLQGACRNNKNIFLISRKERKKFRMEAQL